MQEGASFADRVRIAWAHHLSLGTGAAANLSGTGDLSGAGVEGGAGGGSSGAGAVRGSGDAGGTGAWASQPAESMSLKYEPASEPGDQRMFVAEGGTSVAVRLPAL